MMSEEKKQLVDEVVRREWEMFQQVNNEGGRADCQDNWPTFYVMRSSQYEPWPVELVALFREELVSAELAGRNLVMEKYARMMASTAPARYAEMEPLLPKIDPRCRELTEEIIEIHKRWMAEHAKRYPNLSARGRKLYTEEDTEWDTSAETYLRGELLTWSAPMLGAYLDFMRDCEQKGINLVIEQDRRMIAAYGYESLEQADAQNPV
ncbi:MAG: DUF4125 family protein [Lachnospiraceae bacterium]|nr:DUF4125 family protein [Lachnospiraceae bacterium]